MYIHFGVFMCMYMYMCIHFGVLKSTVVLFSSLYIPAPNSNCKVIYIYIYIYIYYSMGGSVIWLDITRVGSTIFSQAAGE